MLKYSILKIIKTPLFLNLILTASVLSLIFSCRHSADISGLREVCFEGDVLPVFKNNCAISGCHNGQGESGLILDNYTDISRGVIPGKPYSSRIFKSITSTFGEKKMPPGRPLSLENRILIRVWIEQGAKETVCQDASGGGNGGGNGGGSSWNPRACFTRDILPVLVSRCGTSGCHDAATHKEGYNFTTYTTTLNAVSPGNPGQSKLYSVITDNSGENKMPPAGSTQLTTAEIDSIRKWIGYGALNEICGEVCDTINPVTFSGVISPFVQTTCTGCHSGVSPSGGIRLGSYTDIASAASGGLLVKSIRGNGVTRMPPSGPLSTCKIRQFEIWVNNGFPNN